jgi:hypothetical protein
MTCLPYVSCKSEKKEKRINMLEGPDGPVTEQKDMLKIATNYYKDLFSKEDRPNIRLREYFFSHEEQVSPQENIELEKNFTENEVREAVFGPYAEGAPGRMGCPFCFSKPFGKS